MLLPSLIWYLILQLFALSGLPLAFSWFRNIPSRGYAFAKVLGLLLSGVLMWWGSILHLWNNTAASALAAAAVVAALGLWRMRGHWQEVRLWWQSQRAFVWVTEGLFAGAFLLWTMVRATQPQLATIGGEKWMEIAFLNAILRSPTMPPHDPWLSGFAISYYYLGYLLLGMLSQVAAIPATLAFNLGNAAWFALAAVGAYSIVNDLLDGKRAGSALLAPVLLLLTGNGAAFLQVLHARGLLPSWFWAWLDIRGLNQPPETATWMTPATFDWWRASRTLHDYAPISTVGNLIDQEVIDEFPAFSFILGDMHPHLLALPFVLLAIALALNLWKRPESPHVEQTPGGFVRQWANKLTSWLPYAVVLGALGFLNTWDFPIYWALIVAVAVLKQWRERRAPDAEANVAGEPQSDARDGAVTHTYTFLDAVWHTLPEAAMLGVASVLCFFPFWLGLRSQAGGLLPNVFNATHLPQFVVMFLPLAVPVIALVLTAGRQAAMKWYEGMGWGVLITVLAFLLALGLGLIAGAPYIAALRQGAPIMGMTIDNDAVIDSLFRRLLNPWTGLLLAAGVMTLAFALLRSEAALTERHLTFPVLLTLLGLGLTLTPEFLFLKDIFSTRMNTIFKFYFQAWILWSLVGAWWLAKTTTGESRRFMAVAQILSIVLVGAGWVYVGYAIPARAQQNEGLYGSAGTLDGAAWLRERQAADWEALAWLNTHISGAPVILEAPGGQYRAYVYEGRVSALTGLPTVL
ncbi:MAG: hypothetical protein JXB35_02640, partial [Anaerolineae bacterium]|nr:hypothetical protein [Anaerolineae bacterium]